MLAGCEQRSSSSPGGGHGLASCDIGPTLRNVEILLALEAARRAHAVGAEVEAANQTATQDAAWRAVAFALAVWHVRCAGMPGGSSGRHRARAAAQPCRWYTFLLLVAIDMQAV